MKKVGTSILSIALVVGLLFLGFFLVASENVRHENQIKQWAADNNYSVITVERCFMDKGPWWFVDSDNESVYRAFVLDKHDNKRLSYFKFGMFGMEQKWKE